MKTLEQYTHGKLAVTDKQSADRVNKKIGLMVREIIKRAKPGTESEVGILATNMIFALDNLNRFELLEENKAA